MKRSAFFITIVLSSLLGGFFAILLYVRVAPQPAPVYQPVVQPVNQVPMSNWLKDSNFVVPEGLNFMLAADISTPAVVHIQSTYAGVNSDGRPTYDLFRDFFDGESDRYRPSPNQSTGSGVIISPDGYVITNHHVVEEAREIEVTLSNDQRFQAELIGLDPTTDLALIKLEGEGFPYLPFGNSDNVRIGEWVLAVGNPFDLNSTVTAGIVSAKGRNINILGGGATIESFIQTDAAVNPGNSGGALVNLKGELVGVNTAIASRTGSYVGYSFAVPANLARKVAEDLKNYGEVQRALLGINILNVSDMENLNITVNNGVYVSAVRLGSSAEDAGLEQGDVIVQIDGKIVRNVAELQELVGRNRPGDEVEVTYLRNGEEFSTQAVLKNSMGTTAVLRTDPELYLGGASFEKVSETEAEELEIKGGVKITAIEEGPWQEAGIEEGFIITSIDKNTVADLEGLSRLLRGSQGERIIVLGYQPDGDKAYYMMDF
ncbi:MAG TPA: deoxyribonuclease HsdR [Cytophagales bacterium]|nr:deoxyribonuclease HsdR [Cytophagales bacterium]HAA23707.1 deoxyribonuclease HsdR [Cytophagales bacterium]HAP62857.1 deoxyribonuclease HsdR [Cytophagales bacterium]